MQSNNKKKICIVVSSLGAGGAERSAALQSKMLDCLGYEIHVVTVLNKIVYDFSGTLFNLGALKDKEDNFFARFSRLLAFKKYLKQHQFDFVIDHRSRVQWYREFIITRYIYKAFKVIYVIHNFNTRKAFTKYSFLNKLLYKNETMVTVSEEARDTFKKLYTLHNILAIPNGFDIEAIVSRANESTEEVIQGKYIIFFGRLDDQHKNLKLLLESFSKSKLTAHNIKLLVLGDGPDKDLVTAYIERCNLQDHVIMKGFTDNPYPYVKHALFTILTSRYEGFPMVLPESLALRTPVISVDCSSGPKEIIKHAENGLLVVNNNADVLADAMNSFIFDEHLYKRCKNNAQDSVQKFSKENITIAWQKLLAAL